MSGNAFRKVLVLGVLSLLGVTSFQAYLFINSSKLSQQQQEDNIVASLYQVVDDLYVINPEAGKIVNPVRKLSEGYYRVQVNDTLHPYLLENLLSEKFEEHNLNIPFEYAIYDCFTDSTVFASQVNPASKRKDSKYIANLKWKSDGHYFGVYFPTLPNAWLNLPEVLKFSFMLLTLLLVFFGYTLFIVLREKRLQEVKNDFINNVTHQLKTPVTAITLGINAIEKTEKSLPPYFGLIRKETQHLKSIINQVLLASKTESKAVKPKLSPLNATDFFTNWAATKSNAIELEIAENLALLIDKNLFVTVLDNLYDNSLQHNINPVVISITVKKTGKRAQIFYSDTGKGIEPKKLDAVFQKFYSASPQEVNNPRKGFGLGLYIASQAIKKMDGQISALPSKNGVLFELIVKTA